MTIDHYLIRYFNDGRYAHGPAYNKLLYFKRKLHDEYLIEHVHPPFDKINKYEIVKCGKIWILLGSVMCNFIDGQAPRWFEIAVCLDKESLEIWKDLHCMS